MPRKSRYPLNLPDELHEQVRQESAKLGLSVNEFIVRMLSDYFTKPDEHERRIAALEARIAALEGR